MEKIFEAAMYRRLPFVNEAFDEIDKYNNGFLNGSRTSDNLFILNGLVERQLSLGRALYVCFVDFSKAFDKINRSILFYKLMKNGWKGKVIDTFRSLYDKTHFRVKRNGKLSPVILNNIGVNQGGITSGLMFRIYMSDLSEHLSKQFGIVVSNDIIMHILWGDDLIIFSDSVDGLQKQLNGLQKFCSQNKIIVNETKTKSMGVGMAGQFTVYYNRNVINQVEEYKYLGTIIRPIKRWNQDVFYKKYSFICDKSRKAIFGLQKKLKCVKALTPEIRFDIFDTMIRPIITYGSDVWGLCKSGLHDLDKLFLNYIRCVLCIKATTSNIIVYGECGKIPPSIYCHANVLCYFHRLLTMHHGSTVKYVFNVLCNLNDQGFQTWISRAYDLATKYQIDMHSCTDLSSSQFKKFCYERLKNSFMNSWVNDLRNGHESSILRTYSLYKTNFGIKNYLNYISKPKFRIALSKLRASSHDLEIERGRYIRPKLNLNERLCMSCHVIEDEEHFVTVCINNLDMRETLFNKIATKELSFANLSNREKFIYLMSCNDRQILTWFGKFLHNSFQTRNLRTILRS